MSTNPFAQLLGHTLRVAPSTGRATLVVQGKRIPCAQQINPRDHARLLDGEDAAERLEQLDEIKALRRGVANRARSKRYRNKPEAIEKERARLDATREHRRKVYQAWVEKNRDKVRAYKRQQQAKYRADPAKAEAARARARDLQRELRKARRDNMTPEEREARREYMRAYRAANREKINAGQRAWKAKRREMESNQDAIGQDINPTGATS